MKKVFSLMAGLLMVFSLCTPAFAKEAATDSGVCEDMRLIGTTESEMPGIERGENARVVLRNTLSTLEEPARAAWADSTEEILENAYDQSICEIRETEDLIIFEFNAPESVVRGETYVSKVEYVKPESEKASSYRQFPGRTQQVPQPAL